MDETPVYNNMTSSTTISFTCEKNIEATHTGNTRTRFTVVLSVSASGKVLKTMVILKGLKKIPNCNIPKNLAIKVSMCGTMNESLMIEWVNSCFKNRGNFFATAKSILFMDDFGSHKKESVIKALKALNTTVKFFPGKKTHFLQPLDFSINFPFKESLRKYWEEWFTNGKKEFTKKEYRKRPSWEAILGFISNAVNEITSESIRKSFIVCGINEKGQVVESAFLNQRLQDILLLRRVDDENEDLNEESEENLQIDISTETETDSDNSDVSISSDECDA
ncbi:pogo transposable element with KRAB domain-like protein [Dinothrombium tinctorium]|uniref:Pogo transposable element with KRAB domain-like protein n=1 Tax=Dinothrombium tinctorium TaxID=1965070 RepID=A0A3S4Q850_9ACAR|nr:pogo transposable element with KRAB domain-like protein [Dinothrombium tinctorium]